MRVAILGSGGIGLGTAALLCREGHDPVVWSPSGKSTKAMAEGAPLLATGAVAGEFRPRVAASCEEAMAGAPCVIIAAPAFAHRAIMAEAAAHATAAQTLIVSSQYSLSALYLKTELARRGISSPVVAWGTTVVLGRAAGPAEVTVLSLRKRGDIASLPVAGAQDDLALCQSLFGDRFEPRKNAIAIQLSNVNPQVHLANALGNLTRIEKGEAWELYSGITPGLARMIEALDLERLAVARAFDVQVRTIGEHMSLSFDVPSLPLDEVGKRVAARGGTPGPASLDARWMKEDWAYGIVPNIALADIAGVPVPLHRAGLQLFATILGRDLAADNDLLPAMNLGDHTVKSLTQLVT
ncbi:MAG: NAD/NADP octopine/nopaline dehydrogenase [Comamonadaceae bacterium]|nr:MAG: NAD/NADP octopine/nopaline dehydrogenase [Comamonadaceae bacterium]